jgi:hypothetical protein
VCFCVRNGSGGAEKWMSVSPCMQVKEDDFSITTVYSAVGPGRYRPPRHQTHLSPLCLSYMASEDVAGNIYSGLAFTV